MRQILLLTKKNLKLLLRSKASALIIIFAPLLTILILGLSFNNSAQYSLNIGVYATSFTEDVNSVVMLLQEKDFRIIKYETTVSDCIEDMKTGSVNTCIEVPENLQITDNLPKEIVFHIDPSRINLVWMIQDTLKSKFDFKAQQISLSLTQGIINTLTSTKTKINEKSSLVDKIKSENTAAASSAESITSSLSGLDFSVPATTYGEVSLSNLSDDLDVAKEKIDDITSIIDDSELNSSIKAEIKDLLEETDDTLKEISFSIDGNGTASLTMMITSLKSDLEITKGKLNVIAGTISTTTSALQSTSASLHSSIAELDALKNTLTEIQSEIEAQKVTSAETIATPLITKIEKVGKEGTYLNYTFPALLILVIMFGSMLLGTSIVMMEKNGPAFLRNFFLPVRKAAFVLSIYLTNLVLIFIQIAVILGMSLLFLEDITFGIPLVAVILFISASMFTFLGMFIGYIFKSEETGILASISIGSILLFLSGVILPLEGISPLFREITSFNPFVIAEKLIREIMLFNTPLSSMWFNLVLLISYSVLLFVIILVVEMVMHHSFTHRFMKHHHKLHRQKDKINKNDV